MKSDVVSSTLISQLVLLFFNRPRFPSDWHYRKKGSIKLFADWIWLTWDTAYWMMVRFSATLYMTFISPRPQLADWCSLDVLIDRNSSVYHYFLCTETRTLKPHSSCHTHTHRGPLKKIRERLLIESALSLSSGGLWYTDSSDTVRCIPSKQVNKHK